MSRQGDKNPDFHVFQWIFDPKMYYSENPEICWQIDSLVDWVEDTTDKLGAYVAPAVFALQELNVQDGSRWIGDYWVPAMTLLEKRLKKHGKNWLAGTIKPTIADFKVFVPYMVILCNSATPVPEDVKVMLKREMEKFPLYKAWAERMSQELEEHLEDIPSRPL